MFNWIRKLGVYSTNLFERALKEPDVNSRLIFLGTSVVTCFLMLEHSVIYAIAFLRHGTTDPSYPTIMGVFCGGHGFNALGRFFTKKKGDSQNGDGHGVDADSDSPVVPSPPQT
jgi:hypothetical protein